MSYDKVKNRSDVVPTTMNRNASFGICSQRGFVKPMVNVQSLVAQASGSSIDRIHASTDPVISEPYLATKNEMEGQTACEARSWARSRISSLISRARQRGAGCSRAPLQVLSPMIHVSSASPSSLPIFTIRETIQIFFLDNPRCYLPGDE